MLRLPIDTGVMGFIAAGVPEPVVDFESRRAKTDENGVPLYSVSVMALAAGQAEVVSVRVAGEPKGITAGVSLRLTGLTGLPWMMDDRFGVSFRAVTMEPARPDGRSENRTGS
jgi:hypothetical protein